MNTWAPLWSGIVDSSIWQEDDSVRIIFVTMLAKKDSDHIVRASAFNIAKWSNKTEKEVLEALKVLMSPDKKRLEKQPFDGRRVEKVEDGWLILNGETYRKKVSEEMKKARLRRAQSVFRKKHKGEASAEYLDGERRFVAAQQSGNEALADEIAAEASRKIELKTSLALSIYNAYPLKVGKPAALRAIKKAMTKTTPQRLLEITSAFAARKNGDVSFVPHPSTWFNQERYNDDPSTWDRETANGRPKSPMDINNIIKAKETLAGDLKRRHCSDTATDSIWDNPKKKAEFFNLRKEIKTLTLELSAMA